MKKSVVAFFAFAVLAALAAGSWVIPPGRALDRERDFQNTLELFGFDVDTNGQLVHMDLVKKFCEGVWPMGFGFNADSPYLVFKMDPLATGFQTMTFQMRPDEAIVFIGQTPPEARYFSFTSYLNVRFFPQERTAKLIMANLGDSINMLNIKTSGTPNGIAGNPFGQLTIIILVADRDIEARVRSIAARVGFPPQIINTLPILGHMARLGISPYSDRLAVSLRVAFFKNPSEGDAYLGKDNASNGESISPFGVVWRITPKTPPPAAPSYPFTDLPLRVRGSGTTEFHLTGAVETLRAAILGKYAGYEALELDSVQVISEGAEGIQRCTNIMGPTRDCWYIRTPGQFTLADDEFLVVYGVNHKAARRAFYSSAVLYAMDRVETDFPILPNVVDEADWREYIGLTSINSEEHMLGTASAFLPASRIPLNENGEEMLYAVKIARYPDQSDGVACRTIPPPLCPRLTQNEFMVMFRAYVDPMTRVGPAHSELILDRVIKFSPRR